MPDTPIEQRVAAIEVKLSVAQAKVLDLEHEVDRSRTRLHEVEKTYLTVALVAQQVTTLQDEMKGLRGEMAGVRRALLGFALTVAGGMTLFAFTIFTVFK